MKTKYMALVLTFVLSACAGNNIFKENVNFLNSKPFELHSFSGLDSHFSSIQRYDKFSNPLDVTLEQDFVAFCFDGLVCEEPISVEVLNNTYSIFANSFYVYVYFYNFLDLDFLIGSSFESEMSKSSFNENNVVFFLNRGFDFFVEERIFNFSTPKSNKTSNLNEKALISLTTLIKSGLAEL